MPEALMQKEQSMTIRVPRDTSYYYELSPRGTRLVLCLPPDEIARMVERGEARAKILKDYPDGLDFEVSHYELAYFREVYGLHLDLDPSALQQAFAAAVAASDVPLSRTGFLRAESLQELSRQLHAEVRVELPGEAAVPGRTMSLRRKARRRAELEAVRVAAREPRFAPARWDLSPAEMTEGEDAARTFSRLQRRNGR
jgi:hypothetical protein